MESLVSATLGVTFVLMISIAGTSAMECGGIAGALKYQCPNVLSNAFQSDSGSFCCRSFKTGLDYCCDWQSYAAYMINLDPTELPIPMGAIIGIVVGGIVLVLLFCVCCCFCCGLCCFRGRKRVVTEHRTVAFVPTTTSVQSSAATSSHVFPLTSNSYAPLDNHHHQQFPHHQYSMQESSATKGVSPSPPPPYNPQYQSYKR